MGGGGVEVRFYHSRIYLLEVVFLRPGLVYTFGSVRLLAASKGLTRIHIEEPGF